jgi:hypothetical protein
MFPTIQDGDVIWASRCRNLKRLKEGDIVCLVDPREPSEELLKRITSIRFKSNQN